MKVILKTHILRQINKLFALQFEQRRIIANTCAGSAVACLFNVAGKGFLFAILAVIVSYVLLFVAVKLTKKGEGE
ncbi:hypothetical protein [uncultured Cardiobacterium sp.]|uniref:hypothetical protein n=1 Tax=uncultured Cardiobacterium sp. TaxID=417619 RepID=UPI00261AFBFE|nr:hypothetical protein [uncultured Cardiobacterium sp.]